MTFDPRGQRDVDPLAYFTDQYHDVIARVSTVCPLGAELEYLGADAYPIVGLQSSGLTIMVSDEILRGT